MPTVITSDSAADPALGYRERGRRYVTNLAELAKLGRVWTPTNGDRHSPAGDPASTGYPRGGTGLGSARTGTDAAEARIAAGCLLAGVLPVLTDGPEPLATEAEWRIDGGLVVTLLDGTVHTFPSDYLERLRDWLSDRLRDGLSRHQLRTELVAVLGAELGIGGGTPQPRVAGALTALTSLWLVHPPEHPIRAIIRSFIADLFGADPRIRPQDWTDLGASTRDLLRSCAPVPEPGTDLDPYRALRPGRYAALAAVVADQVSRLTNPATTNPATANPATANPATTNAATTGTGPAPDSEPLTTTLRSLVDLLQEAAAGWSERSAHRRDAAQRASRRSTDIRTSMDERSCLVEQSRYSSAQAWHRIRTGQLNPVPSESAARERIFGDAWSRERAHERQAEAAGEELHADRHARIAEAYQRLRELAGTALERYLEVEACLAELHLPSPAAPGSVSTARLARAATDATAAFTRYLEAARAAQPVCLEASVPSGRLPYLHALTDRVNDLVRQLRGPADLRPHDVRQMAIARWRWVVGNDGAVIPVGDLEIRLRFEASDLVEVTESTQDTTQLILAQLPQFPKGTRVVGAARHYRIGREVGNRLSEWLGPLAARLIPDTAVEALPSGLARTALVVRTVVQFLVARVSLGLLLRRSVVNTGAALTLPGRVADNRGPSTLYDVAGEWVVQVRPALPGATWSDENRVGPAAGHETARFPLWVAHGYTEPAPAETVRLHASDPARRHVFPTTYSVASIAGLTTLYDQSLELLGPVGTGARREIADVVWQELPAWLDQSITDPDLVQRPVYDQGRLVGVLGFRTKVRTEDIQPLGTVSVRHFVEAVLVDFAEFSGATGTSSHSFISTLLGIRLLPGSGGGPGFGLRYSPARTEHHTDIAYTAAIHPEVRRNTGPTQGAMVPLTITVHVKRYDTGESRTSAPIDAQAMIRAPIAELYGCGAPVDSAAVEPDQHGRPRQRNGRMVLRADLTPGPPPGRSTRPIRWLGTDTAHGTGVGHVQHLTGIEQIRHQVERWLRDQRWLPATGDDGWPVLSSDPMVASGQLANLRAVREQLSSIRLEGAFDQACQDGIPLRLVRHHVNRAPAHLLLWVRVRQRPESMHLLGHTTALTPVYLEIGAHQFQRETGCSRSRARGAEVFAGTPAIAGASRGAERIPLLSRAVFGCLVRRTTGVFSRAGFRRHKVFIAEGTENGTSAVFATRDLVEVACRYDDGSEHPVAAGEVAGELVVPSGLLEPAAGAIAAAAPGPADGPAPGPAPGTAPGPAAAPVPGPTAAPASGSVVAEVLRQARLLCVNNHGMAAAVQQVTGVQAGSAGYEYLTAAFNVRNAAANGALLSAEQSAEVALDPRVDRWRWFPRRVGVRVRGVPHDIRYVSAENLVLVDGELAMDTFLRSSSVEYAIQFDASAQLGLPHGTVLGGGSRTTVRAHTRSHQQIAAEESLRVMIGVQYLFAVGITWQVRAATRVHAGAARTGTSRRGAPGSDPRSASVTGQALVAVPEPAALRLYADGKCPLPTGQVTDALVRYAAGRLRLDPGLVDAVRARLRGGTNPDAAASDSSPAPAVPGTTSAASSAARRDTVSADAALEGADLADTAHSSTPVPSIRLREPHGAALGLCWFERAWLQLRPGAEAEPPLRPEEADEPLLAAVLRGVDRVLPGACDRSPILRQTLYGQLGGDAWRGLLRRMLETLTIRCEVPYGRYWSTPVEIRLQARLCEPTGFDDGTDLLIRQNYHMSGGGNASSIGVSWGWTGSPDPAHLSAGIGRGYRSTASRQETNTDIQRLGSLHDGVRRVARTLIIEVEVRRHRVSSWRRPARRVVEALAGRAVPDSATLCLAGEVLQVVPAGAIANSPTELERPSEPAAPADPRPLRLPDPLAVEDVELPLREALRPVLAARFGQTWMAESEPALAAQLSRLRLVNLVRRMAARDSAACAELVLPLRFRGAPTVVRVLVHATLTEPTVTNRWGRVELGHDTREESVVGRALHRDRLLPPERAAFLPGPGMTTGGFFSGQSSSESDSQKQGGRNETKLFAVSSAVTIAVRVDLRVQLVTVTIPADAQERVLHQETLGRLATGTAYLTMHAAAYEQMRAGMAQCAHRDSWSWLLEGNPTPLSGDQRAHGTLWPGPRRPRRAREQIGAVRPALDVMALLTNASRCADSPPGQAHRAVAGEVERQLDRAGAVGRERLWLTAPTTGGYAGDPLRLAMLLARERGSDVVLDMRDRDGAVRRYRAVAGGAADNRIRLVAEFPDGGFAAAHAALDPELLESAHRGRVELRELFRTAGRDGYGFRELIRKTVETELPHLNLSHPPQMWPVAATGAFSNW